MSSRIKELNEMIEIVAIAIAREKASVRFYSSALDKATTEAAQRLFSLLLEQEKGHEARLRSQFHEFKASLELEKIKEKTK